MNNQNKRKHAHKRSSSLFEGHQQVHPAEQISLVSQIDSLQTMKLLMESQRKSEFQLIVQSLSQEPHPKDGNWEDSMQAMQLDPQRTTGSLFSEYFQIQSVHSIRRNIINKQRISTSDQYLQKLGTEPKTNSRLRYHRNTKSRAFDAANLKLQFVGGSQVVKRCLIPLMLVSSIKA